MPDSRLIKPPASGKSGQSSLHVDMQSRSTNMIDAAYDAVHTQFASIALFHGSSDDGVSHLNLYGDLRMLRHIAICLLFVSGTLVAADESLTTPESWQPFEFNGRQVYIVPLGMTRAVQGR